ncbi:MAG: A/G-specific adenine glycosylase [Chitinophagia bacterium]|nr:A/G-specific adenine glycosylase [Chitinophagia bacterium]
MDVQPLPEGFFSRELLYWHSSQNDRSLPWKNEKDPYRIWLSEILLQQTRALQALPYYTSFTERYPTIGHLAEANDDDVFRLWQGLGYYNRCKNMLATARHVYYNLAAKFPDTYDSIRELKGVGPYTAAAIAAFAFGLPEAVVDGNVYRVLSRFWGIATPIDSAEGKETFSTLASQLLVKEQSAAYNQAIMDFGATVCTPKNPACTHCPLVTRCAAYRQQTISLLPVKQKKVSVTTRYFQYLVFQNNSSWWITKRTEKDIWQNLFEFYCVESEEALSAKQLLQQPTVASLVGDIPLRYEGETSQRLTHRMIKTRFYTVASSAMPNLPETGIWVPFEELGRYSFPKTIAAWLEQQGRQQTSLF